MSAPWDEVPRSPEPPPLDAAPEPPVDGPPQWESESDRRELLGQLRAAQRRAAEIEAQLEEAVTEIRILQAAPADGAHVVERFYFVTRADLLPALVDANDPRQRFRAGTWTLMARRTFDTPLEAIRSAEYRTHYMSATRPPDVLYVEARYRILGTVQTTVAPLDVVPLAE